MDQRTILAISLSFILLVSYQYFMDTMYPPVMVPQQIEAKVDQTDDIQAEPKPASSGQGGIRVGKGPDGPIAQEAAPGIVKDSVNAPMGKRLNFENSLVRGEIAQVGGRLASLSFLKHLDALPPEGQPIRHLDQDAREFFFAETGFLGTAGVTAPTRETSWQIAGNESLVGAGKLRLTWDNKQGVTFEKTYSFDADSYLFTVTDRIINSGKGAVDLYHYAQFIRVEPVAPEGQPAMAIADFEGPMGYLDETRVQHSYDDLKEADQRQKANVGWAGISDKFFLAALIPTDSGSGTNYYFDYDAPAHRSGTVSDKKTIQPGSDVSIQTRIFVGPKEVKVLESQNLDLERAIDYGWFHFLAEPIVQVLLFLNGIFHNFGVAIILLTVGIKLCFFLWQTRAMSL